jgi:hypothetical protein
MPLQNNIVTPEGASAPYHGTTKTRKIVFSLILAGIVIAVGYAFYVLTISQNKINKVKEKVPQGFLLGSEKQQTYATTGQEGFKLFPKESVGNGLEYVTNTPYREALKQIVEEKKQEGWIAVSGGSQNSLQTTLRLAKGDQALYIKLEVAEGDTTRVIIVPINK